MTTEAIHSSSLTNETPSLTGNKITSMSVFNVTSSLIANVSVTTDANVTISTVTVGPHQDVSASSVFTYSFIFLGVIILVAAVTALIIFLVKKSRLDKLRHHLMPLYNFDPAEEGEDWESELLEEGLDHRLTSKMKKSYRTDEPKLAFSSGI